MPQENDYNMLYLIISCVTMFSAIVSPILTAIINNRHQLKLRKLEIQEKHQYESNLHKQKMLETILINLGACAYNPTPEALSDYGRYYALAFQIFPVSCHPLLRQLNASIIGVSEDSAEKLYEELAIKLETHIANVK